MTRERGTTAVAYHLGAILVVSLSGCFLDWPERSNNDGGVDQGSEDAVDGPADQQLDGAKDDQGGGNCKRHSDCPAGLCDTDGTCPDESSIAYVDDDCGVTQTGNRSTPYCTLDDAVADSRTLVLVRGGIYGPSLVSGTQSFYAEPSAVLYDPTDSCAAVTIGGGDTTDIRLVGFKVGIGKNLQGGVKIDHSNTTVRLSDNDIGPSNCIGVDASGANAKLHLSRNYIHDNLGGLDTGDAASLMIVNNVIVGNGDASTAFGGLKVKGPKTQILLLGFNTVADNLSKGGNNDEAGGVRCESAIELDSNILWGNTPNKLGRQFSPNCRTSHNVLQGGPASHSNIVDDPQFVAGSATGAAYYHIRWTSPARNTASTSSPPIDDFDRQPRADDLPDRGADESIGPACFDGIDNDGDGEVDYPNDTGCSAANDDDEG